MDVDQPARERVDQHGCDDAHPTGHHNGFDVRVFERAHQLLIHGLSAGEKAMVSELTSDTQAAGSRACPTAGIVHHQNTDLGIEVAASDGVMKCLEICACP